MGLNYQTVEKHFDSLQMEIPKDISGKAELGAYLDKAEVDKLKKLAYQGEQRLKFARQLEERPGIDIQGDLKDFFVETQPSKGALLKYCDSLKKLLQEKGCLPDAVTSDTDPRKFKFFFNKEIVTIVVKNKTDLEALQNNLKKCFDLSPINMKAATLNAADPFIPGEKKKCRLYLI